MAMAAAGLMPATTKQGVDYLVSTRQIPLYVKAIDFVHRHNQYALLSRQITHGLTTDEQRLEAVLAWTRQHIQPTPEGWPVVDDHILHIIIRGHGMSDQMADVFTTLLTYAGVPAFWAWRLQADGSPGPVVSFVQVDGRWVVVDVGRRVAFRNARQQLATLPELLAQPQLVQAQLGDQMFSGQAYAAYLQQFDPLEIPRPLRAQLQMPGVRLWEEAKRRVGGRSESRHRSARDDREEPSDHVAATPVL